MTNVFQILQNCLKRNKEKCEYNPNVRVHYADIRRKNFDKDGDIINVKISNINFGINSNSIIDTGIQPHYYMAYIFPIVRQFIIHDNSKEYLQKEIYDMMMIFDFVYENTFYLYRIATEEIDFPSALNILIDKIPNNLHGKFLKVQLTNMLSMTSVRDNKNMHKMAVQLRALRLNGKSDIADKIVYYMSKTLMKSLNEFQKEYKTFLTN